MSLADRLAAARDSRGDGDQPQDDVYEPGEGLPEVDHSIPDPVSPVDAAVAAADAVSRAGKRRADVPTAVGASSGGTAQPGSAQRAPANADQGLRRNFASASQNDRIEELKSTIHVQLLQQMGPRLYDSDMDQNELDSEVRKVLADVLGSQDRPLSSSDRARVTQKISDDILGYGPIEPFLRDPDVSEVMVNGFDSIYVEKSGKLTPVDAHFTDEAHLRRTI